MAYNVVHDDSAARGGPVAIEIERRIGAVRGGVQGVLFLRCKALKPLVDAWHVLQKTPRVKAGFVEIKERARCGNPPPVSRK